jgi:hypothetical protein
MMPENQSAMSFNRSWMGTNLPELDGELTVAHQGLLFLEVHIISYN